MRHRNLLSVTLLGALATLPAASQQNPTPPTQLYIDVLTHNMVGMPDMGGMMGGLGGMLARRMGGGADTARPVYPTTRQGGMTGQYLDIALHNTLKPGIQADDQIPAGLNLGRSLTLVPITETSSPGERPERPSSVTTPDMEMKIVEYWGCGAEVRPGQPKVTTIKMRGGTFDPSKGAMGMQGFDVQTTGSMSRGLYVPDRDIDIKPGHVYWPNRQYGRQVPSGASLAGDHRITGDGIPASMQFQVGQASDFMSRLNLRSQGQMTDAVYLGWPTVANARAYFINGMHMQQLGQNAYQMTVWSSADVPGAGAELHASLSNGNVDKWLKQKVLLPGTATSCVIPRGIFADNGGGASGARSSGAMPAMLTMSAYGPETWITYPPRPADRKQTWRPEWSVRLRTRSTATSMLGMDFGDTQDDPQRNNEQPRRRRGGLLNSILGG